jgi:hypothetical protein
MPNGPRNENLRDHFALAIATGRSVSSWANENNVPKRTCYEWRSTDKFKAKVRRLRRRIIDRAIGRLVKQVTKAVAEMARLATEAKSEAVRLQAARAILGDLMSVMSTIDLEERITALEKRRPEAMTAARGTTSSTS